MSVKIIGTITGKSEREQYIPLSSPISPEKMDYTPYPSDVKSEKSHDGDKPKEESSDEAPKEKSEKIKEIAFFSEPKKVRRKTQRDIFIFQTAAAAALCGIMLLLRLCAPELYNNIHLYFIRLFQ